MKILHILRSEPDDKVKTFIEKLSSDTEYKETHLYKENTDYDELIKDIFDYDKIISWW
jgi:hypothetical protein